MTGRSRVVGRYEVRGELGAGGFATVYRAYDPMLDREVALKVLHPHLARDAAIRDRFLREGRALARVDHPNVVTVWECGETDGSAYLAMKLIRGRPLADILAERGPLPLPDVVAINEQVAAALEAVHAQRLIHRDIKPANIMIEEGSGRAMLLDLGVARDLTNATMTGGVIVGTPGYMAPEQVQAGGQVTPQTDVYQLAATVYALLGGRPPFEGGTVQVLDAIARYAPPELRAARPDLPPAVVDAVAAGMASDPAQRPQGPRAFAARLRIAAGMGGRAPVPPSGIGGQSVEGLPGPRPPAPGPWPVPAFPAPQGSWAQPGPAHGPVRSPRSASRAPLFAVAGIVAVLAVGAMIFAVVGSGGDDRSAADITPIPTTVAGTMTPEDTYQALLAAPFSDSELASGFTVTEVSEGEPDADDETFNAVGVVNVGVRGGGPGAGNAIVFTVYPTEDDARGRYDQGFQAETNVAITGTFNPSGVPAPAQGITATFTDNGAKSGVSYCIVLNGNTHVWGVSLLGNNTQKGNNDTACALARSGVDHLKKVQSGN